MWSAGADGGAKSLRQPDPDLHRPGEEEPQNGRMCSGPTTNDGAQSGRAQPRSKQPGAWGEAGGPCPALTPTPGAGRPSCQMSPRVRRGSRCTSCPSRVRLVQCPGGGSCVTSLSCYLRGLRGSRTQFRSLSAGNQAGSLAFVLTELTAETGRCPYSCQHVPKLLRHPDSAGRQARPECPTGSRDLAHRVHRPDSPVLRGSVLTGGLHRL